MHMGTSISSIPDAIETSRYGLRFNFADSVLHVTNKGERTNGLLRISALLLQRTSAEAAKETLFPFSPMVALSSNAVWGGVTGIDLLSAGDGPLATVSMIARVVNLDM